MPVPEIHLTKKDFKLEWYSGSGAGGQHRNKHQNCCRITHTDTGIKAIGTESRSRNTNQTIAFQRLAELLMAHYRDPPEARRMDGVVIRNYHGPRNEVLDIASRFRQPYKTVVEQGDISTMVDARRVAMGRM